MRDVDTIDQVLRLLAAVWSTIHENNCSTPGTRQVDALLDERLSMSVST